MITRHPMKADGGVHMQLHAFLTSTEDGSNWSMKAPVVLPQGKHTRYPFSRKLCWSQKLSGPFGDTKYLMPLSGIELLFLHYPVLTELSHFHNQLYITCDYITTLGHSVTQLLDALCLSIGGLSFLECLGFAQDPAQIFILQHEAVITRGGQVKCDDIIHIHTHTHTHEIIKSVVVPVSNKTSQSSARDIVQFSRVKTKTQPSLSSALKSDATSYCERWY